MIKLFETDPDPVNVKEYLLDAAFQHQMPQPDHRSLYYVLESGFIHTISVADYKRAKNKDEISFRFGPHSSMVPILSCKIEYD